MAWAQTIDLIIKNLTISYMVYNLLESKWWSILTKSSHDNNGQFSVLIRQMLCLFSGFFFAYLEFGRMNCVPILIASWQLPKVDSNMPTSVTKGSFTNYVYKRSGRKN